MCGEAAANPAMMPLLIAFGLDEFSVSPSLVPECRCKLNNWKLKDALYIADHVMKLKTKSEVLSYLDKKSTIIQ
jgi:phosphotransferase system enzyme I (PtsI)